MYVGWAYNGKSVPFAEGVHLGGLILTALHRMNRGTQDTISLNTEYLHNITQTVSLQVPSCPHQQQTRMVQTHQDSREEGTTKLLPPQETKKICRGS